MTTDLKERTTARKSSRFGTTYTTTWDGKFSASFTFWPAHGGYHSISRFGGKAFRQFHRSYECVMDECCSVTDPEHNGRYAYDNEPHIRLSRALDALKVAA